MIKSIGLVMDKNEHKAYEQLKSAICNSNYEVMLRVRAIVLGYSPEGFADFTKEIYILEAMAKDKIITIEELFDSAKKILDFIEITAKKDEMDVLKTINVLSRNGKLVKIVHNEENTNTG